MEFKDLDIISADQFDRKGVEELFTLAHRMRPIANREVRSQVLQGYILGSYFFEESTRTRLSSETAFRRLGGEVNTLTDLEMSSMVKGESWPDNFKILATYCDLMVVRTPDAGLAQIAADCSDKPVINAGDGKGEHPTQALLDTFTIQEERGRIDGLTIGMFGDLKLGRTVHSLAKLLMLFEGVRFVFVAPEDSQMPPFLVQEIRNKGFEVFQTENFKEGLSRIDVGYFVRPQKSRAGEAGGQLVHSLSDYVLTREIVLTVCKPEIAILHPLPRNQEISADVDDLPQAAYFRQPANGVLVRMAANVLILNKQGKFV